MTSVSRHTPLRRRPPARRHPLAWVGLMALLAWLPAPSLAGEEPTPTLYVLDQQIRPSRLALPGVRGGPSRPIGVMVRPDGRRDEFVANEVILRPKNEEDLQAFLTAYGGTVLRDGTPLRIAGAPVPPVPLEPSGWYLIRVDVQRSSLDDLAPNLARRGHRERVAFSSEGAARLIALVAREAPRFAVGPNLFLQGHSSLEHPLYVGGHVDWETLWWMTEDDNPTLPGDQGLSVGVTQAWRYLRYVGIPPSEGEWTPPVVAIIDGGFDLDETTGVPLHGNLDYFYYGSAPLQADFIDYDGTAGGENPNRCTGGASCPWHGQGAFGVAAARPRNLFGAAGTGGPVAIPMLLKVDGSFYMAADAIRSAALNGARVINLSFGGGCLVSPWICAVPPDDIYAYMKSAIALANSLGAVVIASAGNEGIDLDSDDVIPCETDGVICVGAVTSTGAAASYSNYGGGVDIWAPTGILSTVTPLSAAWDADDLGFDELYLFSGTSASAPFVAGIVALMKALNPAIWWKDVEAILQDTANPSTEAKIMPGYVDAFRAVERARPNQPPAVVITAPSEGAVVSWGGRAFFADASDPEVDLVFDYEFPSLVTFASDRDGLLCSDNNVPFNCFGGPLSLGVHVITATVTDAFGATATDAITITVVNRAPVVTITEPADGAIFYSHQLIPFKVYVSDEALPFPDAQIAWSSQLDGPLGTGWQVQTALSPGLHTVTATATDAFGVSAQDSITVQVLAGTGVPSATILSPADGLFVAPGTVITLQGRGTDPEEGTLPGARLQWSSDRDGVLGTGTSLQVVLSGPAQACNPETVTHRITLQVTDSDGHQVTEYITVSVGRIC